MMHKKAHKQFAEDKQTKDMDYWNHVLWSARLSSQKEASSKDDAQESLQTVC